MAMAVCWNCGARVASPTCQMCGAAQQPGGAQGQPVMNQASMSVRPPQLAAGNHYAPGGQYPYPPANQVSGWQPQPQPSQPAWQGQQPPAGQAGWQNYQPQPGYQQPGSQQPSAYQQQQAAMGMRSAVPAASQTATLNPVALLLGVAGGTVGGLVGGVIWAAVLNLTNYNVYYLAILIGILAGAGVALGARGQNRIVLAVIAAVVGLLTFLVALYLRVSYWERLSFTGLPIGDFTRAMGDYLQTNPINYIFFLGVPLIAAITAFRGLNQRRIVRRR